MNAISHLRTDEQAERRARHLSVCQDLIDLGMKLARAAAQQAMEALETQPVPNPANPATGS